jgi:predicted MFS family arabinose efflux permease
VLRPLRSRDYRLFWSGSLIANLGLWIQQIALGWFVYDLTRSASVLGTVSFCGNLPVLMLGLLGGAIADRASRRTIMLGTLSVIAVAALALSLLTASGHIAIWHIIAISMIAGGASALFGPAMQAVIPSLVAPGELLNAISLNSVQFNLARTVGPALAGLAYGAIGPAGCFAVNAAGFLVMVIMIARVRLPRGAPVAAPPVGRALRDGLRYARTHPVIGPSLLLAAVMSIFGFPYIILLPALARETLGLDAAGLGWLMASVGAGAVVGGLGLSAAGDMPRRDLVIMASAMSFGVVLAGLDVVRSARAIALLLFVMGALQTICVASINTTIQLSVHDGMRGRVMSMMTVILFGFATSGALLIGSVGDRVGVVHALAGGGAVIVLVAIAVVGRTSPVPRAVEEI